MESKTKLLGHPVHPILIVLPLGLFIATVLFDALYLWRGIAVLAEVAYWNLALGIIGALLAALFGLLDWLAIPAGTRAKRIGAAHGVTNLLVVILFAAVWAVRASHTDAAPGTGLFVVELVALGLGSVGGWLGGELVYRLAVSVDADAHLDASSSLARPRDVAPSERPAALASKPRPR
jgi:uncharacterized membrane protein